MTTIAFDGRYVAADSRLTRILTDCNNPICGVCGAPADDIYEDRADKLYPGQNATYKFERIIAVAGVGEYHYAQHFSKMASKTKNFDKTIETLKATVLNDDNAATCEIHIFTDQAYYGIYFKGSYPDTIKCSPYATKATSGTGSMPARVAMDQYAENAMRALEIATKYDQGTGGAIKYIDVTAAIKDPKAPIEVKTHVPKR